MTEQEIKILLDKYYKGLTSLEEEGQIKSFFRATDFSDELASDKNLMSLVTSGQAFSPQAKFEFDEKIKAELLKERTDTRKIYWQWSLRGAAAVIFLLASFWLGRISSQSNQKEYLQLQAQVSKMNTELIRTNLRLTSPSDRIKGVQYSYELNSLSNDIIDELAHTLNNDENVNVRLAAGNALFQFAHNEKTKKTLIESINKQNQHPLIQISLINMMFALNEKTAFENIKEAIQNENLPFEDRQRIQKELNSQSRSL